MRRKIKNNKIVDFVQDSTWNLWDSSSDEGEESDRESDDNNEETNSDNPNSKYVGRWSYYVVSQGQRVKVYTAVLHSDLSADFITYLPDGSVNASMSFSKCVFQNGYVYFTDNGDINVKGTPRFRLGSDGLQHADGNNLAKE